ncbi:hypothetical protein INT43_002678 [Umbelopsis isabellina]|uniref:Zn(2)-C6 fungal-type domain-containing protein n=1 Tax=Mortierella isabellina TaxID=91625 RepID=A0A8H7Q6J3_MORIS|nr:hypothetical protein INT43_002678 [Umbelopsis isabellina]
MSGDYRNDIPALSPDDSSALFSEESYALQQRLYTLGVQKPLSDAEQSSSTQFHSITPQSFQIASGDPSNPTFHSRPRQRRPGFSCDTCRKRRVRCDRTHPVCNRCRGKRVCSYPDSSRFRKKKDSSDSSSPSPTQTLQRPMIHPRRPTKPTFRVLHRRSISPSPIPASARAYPSPTTPKTPISSDLPTNRLAKRQRCLSFSSDEDISVYTSQIVDTESQLQLSRITQDGLLIELLAATGWQIIPLGNGVVRFETNIDSLEQLRSIIFTTMNLLERNGNMMPTQMGDPFNIATNANQHMHIQRRLPQGISHVSLFERLAMLTRPGAWHPDMSSNLPAQQLSTDKHMMTITARHFPHYVNHLSECTLPFPMLIWPQDTQKKYSKAILVSLLGYMVPHYCFWHSWSPLGRTVHYHRDCGKHYFDKANLLSEDATDVPAIFQHLMCIAREYDRGNMQSAYLTMGIAMSLCFSLNLHLKEGYDRFTDPYDREFAKRVFWSLWWYDTTVPQLYSSPAVIDPDEVTADYPLAIEEFDSLEKAKATYINIVLKGRRISRVLAKRMKSRKPEIDELEELQFLLEQEKEICLNYRTNHNYISIYNLRRPAVMNDIWRRRTLCMAMCDHCVNWLSLYQRHLPSETRTEPLSYLQVLAIRVCSEAADTLTALFDAWFTSCGLNFDCLFRPFSGHLSMGIKGSSSKVCRFNEIDVAIILENTNAEFVPQEPYRYRFKQFLPKVPYHRRHSSDLDAYIRFHMEHIRKGLLHLEINSGTHTHHLMLSPLAGQ